MEAKKNIIMRIYQILYNYSSQERPLTQQDIINYLERDYGIECERKAVGRNISFLKEMGDFDIETNAKGTYISQRQFESSELRLLIDSVLCSRNVNSVHSDSLIKKLIALGGNDFKNYVKHVYSVKDWDKSENKDFFLNIELVGDAIEDGKKISFDYMKRGLDKKLHSTGRHTASPYQMLLRNQRYYLMLRDDKYEDVGFLRMDKITNMGILNEPAFPLRDNPGYERGINYGDLANALPYMFSDKQVMVTIKCPNFMADELCDWFGMSFSAKRVDDEHFEATVKSSEKAMLYWALQYNSNVEILSPSSLRDELIFTLESTLALYKN